MQTLRVMGLSMLRGVCKGYRQQNTGLGLGGLGHITFLLFGGILVSFMEQYIHQVTQKTYHAKVPFAESLF